MAEEIEKDEVIEETDKETEDTESDSSSTEETDYKALAVMQEAIALAEKERADAAEALIIKNKKLSKRHADDEEEPAEKPITESRLLEILKDFKPQKDDEETNRLAEAQKKVRELQSKAEEILRASKAKGGVSSDTATTHRDGEKKVEPKLPANSPLKSYKYEGGGVYSKKLVSGKTMFVNTKAGGGERKKWIE